MRRSLLASASALLSGPKVVTSGTVPLAGVLRVEKAVDLSGSRWALLNDAGHKPINLSGVTDMGEYLQLNYSTVFTHVGAVVVSPDEEMARLGYVAGVSAGLSYANMFIYDRDGARVRPAFMPYAPSRNFWVTGQMWL